VFGLLDAEVARDIAWPVLRLRALGAVAWAARLDDDPDPDTIGPRVSPALDWGAIATDGLRPSLGIGVGLFWDVMRIDLHRGLRGGEWQFILSVDRSLWGLL
jgi:hypothetical protein